VPLASIKTLQEFEYSSAASQIWHNWTTKEGRLNKQINYKRTTWVAAFHKKIIGIRNYYRPKQVFQFWYQICVVKIK
jgi:hypothetical protein